MVGWSLLLCVWMRRGEIKWTEGSWLRVENVAPQTHGNGIGALLLQPRLWLTPELFTQIDNAMIIQRETIRQLAIWKIDLKMTTNLEFIFHAPNIRLNSFLVAKHSAQHFTIKLNSNGHRQVFLQINAISSCRVVAVKAESKNEAVKGGENVINSGNTWNIYL